MMLFRVPLAVGEGLMQRLSFRGVPSRAWRVPSVAGIDHIAARRHKAGVPGCRTIGEAIATMTELGERFEAEHGPHDGVLWFNRLYLAVTKGVQEAVNQDGYFSDPTMIAELDVLFAQLYFDGVDAADRGEEHPAWAWRILLESRSNPDILPIQFAVAGMNAHINHDLPIALLEQWERHGRRPSHHGAAYADYTKINKILKREEMLLKGSLEQGIPRALDSGPLGKLEDKLALWIVEDARARAWQTAHHLWSVRHVPALRRAWLTTVDGAVAAIGKLLLEPV
jgi:hypothetical protein